MATIPFLHQRRTGTAPAGCRDHGAVARFINFARQILRCERSSPRMHACMQCGNTLVTLADHESCYLSASSDATRTHPNFPSCSASGQAASSPFTPLIQPASTLSTRRPLSLRSGCLARNAPSPRFRSLFHQRVRQPDAYGSTRDMPHRTFTNTTLPRSVLGG